MRQHQATNRVEPGFAIPAGAPEPVEEAWARFDDLATQLVELREAAKAAPEKLRMARQLDSEEAAAAYASGTTPKGCRQACRQG